MDVKGAITKAKIYVAEMFSDESIANIGLEEVRIDDADRNWLITVGFSRVPVSSQKAGSLLEYSPDLPRTYKVVKLKAEDGAFISITNRTIES